MKKCDEQVKIRDEQARGAEMEGEIHHGAFEEGLDRIGAQRRKTASGSPKGERSESINRIIRITGVGGKAFDLP